MQKLKSPRKTPAFRSERAARTFWEAHDSADHVDWSAAKLAVFPNLKPSTETISLRLSAGLLVELKALGLSAGCAIPIAAENLSRRTRRERARE
jgi:hypothetical protein